MKKCLKRRILPLLCTIVLLIGALTVPIGAVVPSGASLVNFFRPLSFECYDWYDGASMYCYGDVSSGTLSFSYYGTKYGLLSVECKGVTFGDLFPNAVPGRTYTIAFDSYYCSNPYFNIWVNGSNTPLYSGTSFVWTEEMSMAYFVFSTSISSGVSNFTISDIVLVQDFSISGSAASSYFTPYNEAYFNSLDIDEQLLEAKKQGYDSGYAVGKQEGIEIANSGTFTSLITAVVDAPIKAITGLLDFEILGQNMLSFFGALLSLCLILFILKRVI